jgi:hypothetical protein
MPRLEASRANSFIASTMLDVVPSRITVSNGPRRSIEKEISSKHTDEYAAFVFALFLDDVKHLISQIFLSCILSSFELNPALTD